MAHLHVALDLSWKWHPTKKQCYLPPVLWVIQERRRRFVGHFLRSNNELISVILFWSRNTNTLALKTLQDVNLKTYQLQWIVVKTIEMWGSVQSAPGDDDDENIIFLSFWWLHATSWLKSNEFLKVFFFHILNLLELLSR